VRLAAPIAALVLVASLLHAGTAHGQSTVTAYEGRVTEFYGTPVPAQAAIDATGQGVGVNRINFSLEDLPGSQAATISGDLRFEAQGAALDENNRRIGLVCFRFELSLSGRSLPITSAAGDTTYYEMPVDVNVFSSDAACAQGGGELTPEQGQLELTRDLESDTLDGSLKFGADALHFQMNRIKDTGFTTLLDGISLTPDVIGEVFAASACPEGAFEDRPFSDRPAACQAPGTLAVKFAREFSKDFKDQHILKDLTVVILLRSLVKPDGKRLLPTLNRLLKPIALLAIKADSEGDASARLAMNRLIGVAIGLDLEAAK
jgi:hypothetical protein